MRNAREAAVIASLDDRITPVIIDVTHRASIAAAVPQVEEYAVPLGGLVNNAGIAIVGPLEYLPLDELRKQWKSTSSARSQ